MQAKVDAEEVLRIHIRDLQANYTDLPNYPNQLEIQKGNTPKTTRTTRPLSVGLGNKVMNAITLMATVTGAPHSWLSQSAQQHELRARVINLHNGYDLYKSETWEHLRDLRQRHKPLKIWFSLPCTKWCPWNYMNYKHRGREEQLETAKRRERRMLWHVNQFIKETMIADPQVMIYFEWPTQCLGWKQWPMEDLREFMEARGQPRATCRMDGCRYGLRELKVKMVDLYTSGGPSGESEWSAASYYPWKFVQSACRFWHDGLAPNRHLRLLQRRDDLPVEVDRPGSDEVDNDGIVYANLVEDQLSDIEDDVDSQPLEIYLKKMDRLTLKSIFDEATAKEEYTFEALETLLEFFNVYYKAIHEHSRWNPGQGCSIAFGGYSHGAFSGVSKATEQFDFLVRYVNTFFKCHQPQAFWSSLMDCGYVDPFKVMMWSEGDVYPMGYQNGHFLLHDPDDTLDVPDGPTVEDAVPEGIDKSEYQKWQAQVAKFHKAAGHPTNRNLARIIKEAGHPEWKIQVAKEFYCPGCESFRPGGMSSGQVPPAQKEEGEVLLLMDVATKLRAAHVLYLCDFLEMRAESGRHFIEAISERWLSVFPRRKVVILDSAKSFMSEQASDFLRDLQVLVHYLAEKEPWANGVIEAAIQDVRHTASAIYLEAMDVDLSATLHMAVSALNATELTAGYSAHQSAVGASHQPTDEDRLAFELVEPKSDFARLVVCRQRAEEIARQAKAKRVLVKLHNTSVRQPLRQFSPLDLVKVWRKVWPKEQHSGPRGGFKKSGRPHWIGPGRILFQEALPHQQRGEERIHVVWVLVGSQLLRCSVHSVRPVTETERLQHEITTEEDFTRWRSLADVLPRRKYTDLMDQAPNEDETELPNLPERPDPSWSFHIGDYDRR
ncbi:unnamed protein product [Symbiodinium sp. CCMP2592]|nr:unnamed protein product [Symbiodinium sp. CCMP2592]